MSSHALLFLPLGGGNALLNVWVFIGSPVVLQDLPNEVPSGSRKLLKEMIHLFEELVDQVQTQEFPNC